MGRMAKRKDDVDRRERTHHGPRPSTFAGHWLAALLVLGIGFALRLYVNTQPGVVAPGLLGAVLVVAALYLGERARVVGETLGRKPVFYRHVRLTFYAVFGVWFALAIFGWSGTLGMIVIAVLAVGALSWNLHRTDALRADPRGNDDEDSWGKVFGIPKTRIGRITRTDHAVNVELHHDGGETHHDVAAALPKIESAAGAVAGRGRVVKGERADTSRLTYITDDPFDQWLELPGLSRPGGSFVEPIRTSYYDTGDWEHYTFAAGQEANGMPRAACSRGRMGMTRSGKTGEAKNEVAEVLSRRDVLVLYADATKGEQGAGPLLHFFTAYADTTSKAKLLFNAVKKLVQYRADLMGQHGYTDWTPEVYAKLGLPAIYYFLDEADELINTPVFKWLATKGLSTGVFLSVTLPRADHESMPPTARYSIGAWKCFGTGDEYSAAFALTEATRKAGAQPEDWRIQFPGAHFHDTAPGIPPQMYPVPLRSGRSDHEQLAAWVAEARATFTPAVLTAEEAKILGENGALTACDPANRRALMANPAGAIEGQASPVQPGADPPAGEGGTPAQGGPAKPKPTPQDGARPTPAQEPVEGGEDDDMADEADQDWTPDDDDEEELKLPPKSPQDAADYAAIDPREPVVAGPDSDIGELDDGKGIPATREEMITEFNRVVVELVAEGHEILRNKMIYDKARIWSESWVSKRLSAVCEDASISPPGIRLERIEGRYGHFQVIVEPELAIAAAAASNPE
jgi:hypothetical protein